MINLLGFALYGPLAASHRYRLGQYVPGLREHGIELHVCHLLCDRYLRSLVDGSPTPWLNLTYAGFARLYDLVRGRRFDAAILHCELFPLLPGWVERAILPRPYIYDFDDAFYLKYQRQTFGLVQPFLAHKFDTVMAGAAAITAGNSALATYARQHNSNTHMFPTVVDTERYVPVARSPNASFTVGWIGSPSTAPYLCEIVEALSVVGKECSVRLVVIGGKAPSIPHVTVSELPWCENTEVPLINSFDVGLMPLPDDDWALGKCAFKLIQYMACGVAVIASRVGANIDVVQPDCGRLVSGTDEWVQALRQLRDNVTMRQQMGEAGRARVEQHYSLRRNLPLLAQTVRAAVEGGQ